LAAITPQLQMYFLGPTHLMDFPRSNLKRRLGKLDCTKI